ncbi:hypothetical protein JCM10449v2_008080 [Rhodotorula kratochvilovae]
MDGFHRTQAELAADADPELSFRRRGTPFTFAPDKLLDVVRRIRTEQRVPAPAFSHAEKDPVEGAVVVEPHHRIVIVEGNYLLLDEPVWRDISREMDERWFYSVPEGVALRRIIKRHVQAGLAPDEQAAEEKALANDVLNGRHILANMLRPDRVLLSDSVFDLFSMKGRVTAITGGGSGIGWATAQALAEAGGDVAIIGRRNQDAKAEELSKKYGVRCKAYSTDVSDAAAIEKTIDDIGNTFGRLDCFIANAGGGVPGSIDENYDLESWKSTMDVNLNATFYCARACAKWFKKAAESGVKASFIATTSISARIVNVPYDQPPYNASKAGVVHFCRSLARDWRNFARVNCISPGFFDTAMGPSDAEVEKIVYRLSVFGRPGDVKELKAAYLYLASNASSYTTGTDLLVDGGYCLT